MVDTVFEDEASVEVLLSVPESRLIELVREETILREVFKIEDSVTRLLLNEIMKVHTLPSETITIRKPDMVLLQKQINYIVSKFDEDAILYEVEGLYNFLTNIADEVEKQLGYKLMTEAP